MTGGDEWRYCALRRHIHGAMDGLLARLFGTLPDVHEIWFGIDNTRPEACKRWQGIVNTPSQTC